MKTRAVLLTRAGLVHRVLIQPDGSDGTGCGVKYAIKHMQAVPVTPLQALVYHLEGCQSTECWKPGGWKVFVEGVLR